MATKRNLMQIYALGLCFFCAAGLAITLCIMGYALVQVAAPDVTVPGYHYQKHADSTAYRHWRVQTSAEQLQQKYVDMSENELEEERQQAVNRLIAGERRQGYQTLLRCVIALIVFGSIFLLHWRLSRRHAESSA